MTSNISLNNTWQKSLFLVTKQADTEKAGPPSLPFTFLSPQPSSTIPTNLHYGLNDGDRAEGKKLWCVWVCIGGIDWRNVKKLQLHTQG